MGNYLHMNHNKKKMPSYKNKKTVKWFWSGCFFVFTAAEKPTEDVKQNTDEEERKSTNNK